MASTLRTRSNSGVTWRARPNWPLKSLGYSIERSGTSRLVTGFYYIKPRCDHTWSIAPISGPEPPSTSFFLLTPSNAGQFVLLTIPNSQPVWNLSDTGETLALCACSTVYLTGSARRNFSSWCHRHVSTIVPPAKGATPIPTSWMPTIPRTYGLHVRSSREHAGCGMSSLPRCSLRAITWGSLKSESTRH